MTERQATGSILLSACAFGSLSTAVILADRAGVALIALMAWRYALAAPLLVVAAGGLRALRIPWREAGALLLLGGTGQMVITTMSFSSLRWLTSAQLGFLFYTYPAWVALLMAIAGVERLTRGRLVALGLALAHPGRLRTIAAANCVARMAPAVHAVWDERARIAREQGMGPLVAPSLERWFTAGTRESRATELAWAGEMLAATPVAGYAAACGALKTMDYLDALPRITVPTLFIAGTHDAGAPPEAMRDMHARVPGARLVELDAAHVSNLEQPAAFSAALEGFLREHPR